MVGWRRGLSGHGFEQTPGDGEGQGSQACCSPWGHKESDMTEQLKNKKCTTIRVGPERRLSAEEVMLQNYGTGEDS